MSEIRLRDARNMSRDGWYHASIAVLAFLGVFVAMIQPPVPGSFLSSIIAAAAFAAVATFALGDVEDCLREVGA